DASLLSAQRLRRDFAHQRFLQNRRRQGCVLQEADTAMSVSPTTALYLALGLYAAGTLAAFASLFARIARAQRVALVLMIAGFVAHTVWIGSICVRTHHPPITNLPEAASFLAWCIFAFEMVILLRYRVHAASFFVYPLVLILLTISAVIREPFA